MGQGRPGELLSGAVAVVLRTPLRDPHPSIERELGRDSRWRLATVTDPGEPRNAWRGNQAAWRHALSLRAGADWLIVIEDDAQLCQRFATAALSALTHAPTRAVNFYALRKPCREALARGDSWATPAAWLSNLCIALRPGVAQRYLAYCDADQARLDAYCRTSGDCRIHQFSRAENVRFSFPVPSLVQHAGPVSLLGHSAGRTRIFCDDLGINPLRINWSRHA